MNYIVLVAQTSKYYQGNTPDEALDTFETSTGMSYDEQHHMLIRVPNALSVKKWVVEEKPVVVVNRKEK